MRVLKSGPYDQLILFGDSITEQSASQELGFAFMPALQNVYMRRMDVINRGFSGYNTAHAIRVLPSFMPTTQQATVRILVVFFGANDAVLPSDQPSQHVPLDQYVQNLKDIVTHPTVESHRPQILLITPPPVDEYAQRVVDLEKDFANIGRTAEHTKKYAEACIEVGRDLGVPVLDLWGIIMANAGWKDGATLPGSKSLPPNPYLKKLLRDGLHFNPDGYKVLFNEVKTAIESEWPEQISTNLPPVFPYWADASK